MNDRQLEQALRAAAEHAAPDDLDGLLSRCGPQKGIVIPMEERKTTPPARRRALPVLIAACLVLVFAGGIFAANRLQNGRVTSVVSLDVNPSITLKLNSQEVVLEAIAENADAQVVLDGMDLKGDDLNKAMNAIIGSLLKNGYVDQLANSILITVEDKDAQRAASLQEKLSAEAETILSAAQVSGAILSQTLDGSDAALAELAAAYGISEGKAALIQSIVDASGGVQSFEGLVGLSINELNLLSSSMVVPQGTNPGVNDDRTLVSTGTPDQSGYIGADAALQAAYAAAGVSAGDVILIKSGFDYEDGRMVYEMEFLAGDVKYEYDIDAATGAVVKSERESYAGVQQNVQSADMGRDAALEAACTAAGVSAGDVSDLTVEKDYDHGRLVYEINFWCGTDSYEFEIDAATGEVRKQEQESHPGALSSGDAIGRDAAMDIALQDAGFSRDQVYELEADAELDERTPHYEVEFKSGGMEYSYKIDAATGTILARESEWD